MQKRMAAEIVYQAQATSCEEFVKSVLTRREGYSEDWNLVLEHYKRAWIELQEDPEKGGRCLAEVHSELARFRKRVNADTHIMLKALDTWIEYALTDKCWICKCDVDGTNELQSDSGPCCLLCLRCLPPHSQDAVNQMRAEERVQLAKRLAARRNRDTVN